VSTDDSIELADRLYAFLIYYCLVLSERHSTITEKEKGLPSSIQHAYGYRSAPKLARIRQLEQWKAARLQHERLDQLSMDEYLDWNLYEKESFLPRPPEITDPYAIAEQELNKKFGAVEGIPGFYLDNDYLRLKTFPPYSLIVPVRVDGIIRALQLYHRADGSDFIWYSTPYAKGGASAHASIHIRNEFLAHHEGKAIIVSHTIEADALSWAKHKGVIALNGLSPTRARRAIQAAMPRLKRLAVPSQFDLLARTLREYGYTVRTFDERRQSHEDVT
jgi:hypothetical protein